MSLKKTIGLMGFILLYSVFLINSPLTADTISFDVSQEKLKGYTDASLEVRNYSQTDGPDVAISGYNGVGDPLLEVILFDDGKRSGRVFLKSEVVADGDLEAADLNNSSRADLLASGNTASDSADFLFLCNNFSDQECSNSDTAPNFVEKTFPDSGLKKGSIAVAEATGDTLPDVAVTGKNGSGTPVFRIYQQDSAGSFVLHSDTDSFPPGNIDGGLYNSALAWGNYNGDTYPDLAALGHDGDTRHLNVFINQAGSGLFNYRNFTWDNDKVRGLSKGDLAWVDYDRDGDSDLVVSGVDRKNNPRLIFFENTRDDPTEGSFDRFLNPLGTENGYGQSSLEWKDFDQDGDRDLAIMGTTQNDTALDLYLNDGSGDFSNFGAVLPDSGVTRGDLGWADFDGDGRTDLVVAGSNRSGSPSLFIALNKVDVGGSDDGSDGSNNSDDNECVIERTRVLKPYESDLRSVRDFLLGSRFGRWLTKLYYSGTGFS